MSSINPESIDNLFKVHKISPYNITSINSNNYHKGDDYINAKHIIKYPIPQDFNDNLHRLYHYNFDDNNSRIDFKPFSKRLNFSDDEYLKWHTINKQSLSDEVKEINNIYINKNIKNNTNMVNSAYGDIQYFNKYK